MGIRDMSVEPSTASTHPELADRARDLRARRHDARSAAALAKPIVDTAIPYDAVWDCVTCGRCVEACPVLIEHVDKIVGLRRNLVPRGVALSRRS
jgi:Fe-S oxidoreductase